MTDDLRERVARAIANYHTIPWGNMPEARKNRPLAYADAALAAERDALRAENKAMRNATIYVGSALSDYKEAISRPRAALKEKNDGE